MYVSLAGPEAVEAQCQRLEVRSRDGGTLLFTADEEEVIMAAEKFTVTGKTVLQSHSIVFGYLKQTI